MKTKLALFPMALFFILSTSNAAFSETRTISWDKATTYMDGSPIEPYVTVFTNIYWTKDPYLNPSALNTIASGISSSSTTFDPEVQGMHRGQTIYFTAKTVLSTGEESVFAHGFKWVVPISHSKNPLSIFSAFKHFVSEILIFITKHVWTAGNAIAYRLPSPPRNLTVSTETPPPPPRSIPVPSWPPPAPPPPPKPPVVSTPPPPPVIYKNGGPRNWKKANGGDLTTRAAERKLPQILWNLWAEKKDAPNEKPLFNPVSHLEQGKYYLVTLDLSGISYKEYTRSVGTGLDNAIRKWIKEKEPEVDLTAVMLVDPLHFEAPDGGNVRILKVDLGKIDRFANPDNVVHDNVFLFLKQKAEQKADPYFVFGRVAFRVKTRTGQAGGPASISLSLWVNNRPIDEISVKLCIAPESGEPSCGGIAESQFCLRGVDSLRIASDKSPFPDAALHFLELGSEGVFGVFHRNDNTSINDNTLKSKYLTWRLKKSPEKLISDLSNWVQAFVATGSDNTDLLNRGVGLYNLLFTSDDPEAKEVLSAWQEFIRPQLVRDASATDYRPPSIFVRLIQEGPDPPLFVPLGLAAVSLDNKPATFLGYYFRIETPLEIQSYRSDNNCLSRWVTVVPEGEATLAKATSRMGENVAVWRERSAKSFKSIWEFGDWIRQGQNDASPTALIILSHHAKDRIFAASEDLITSDEVKRKFPEPSVVILSGCGTGGPGAVGFLRKFNLNGIGTVIATSTEVDPYMAGDFLNELDNVLKENEKEKRFTLADAYFRTVQRMWEKYPPDSNVPYGARALEFVLVGNGNIRLCPPKK